MKRCVPDGLVSDDNLGPVLYLARNSLELPGNDRDGLVGLALLS